MRTIEVSSMNLGDRGVSFKNLSSGKGKPIFDPYESHSDPTHSPGDGYMNHSESRRKYVVFKPCGTCRGTGKARNPHGTKVIDRREVSCSQCLLAGADLVFSDGLYGAKYELFAHELTESDISSMNQSMRDEVNRDDYSLQERNRLAKAQASMMTNREYLDLFAETRRKRPIVEVKA